MLSESDVNQHNRDFSELRAGHTFRRIGDLCLAKGSDGEIVQYRHELPTGTRPNRHAAGPFCAFELPEASPEAGVYAFVVREVVKYIGECEALDRRFGSAGYGRIAARNCHSDGQSTNCKINGLVLKTYQAGDSVTIWFMPTADRKLVESQLVSRLAPPWNGAQPSSSEPKRPSSPPSSSSAAGSDFVKALNAAFLEAERAGQSSIRVKSGDLHRQVGGYPGPSHRMPVCCKVMRSAMFPGDRILEAPPKGAGASLVVEYVLPRGVAR
jgi:5-methylcytosine-specific restriction protein A